MSLTYSQLEGLWINAGGPSSLAPLMAAIALAESGGNPGENNYTDNNGTQTSWGLWQISNGTHSWPSSQNPNNPEVNARLAVQKYHSQGLSAWGTYDSGAYRQYMQGGVPPNASGIPATDMSATTTGFGGDVLNLATGGLSGDISDVLHGNWTALFNPLTGGFLGSLNDAVGMIGKDLRAVGDVFAAFMWLMNPGNQLRIWSGFAGVLILGIAGYLLATS